MSKWKTIIGMLLMIFIVNVSYVSVQAEEERATGLIDVSEEEEAAFFEDKPQVTDVLINEMGFENLQTYYDMNGLSLSDDIELAELGNDVLLEDDATYKGTSYASVKNLPTSVDISMNNSFPPVGNQENCGSCTAWAMGYYQMTNNIANIRGLDAKNNEQYRISPRWLYDLIRVEPEKEGSTYIDAIAVASNQGVPFWTDSDGATPSDKYITSWKPDADVWEKALYNKMIATTPISIFSEDGKTLDLSVVKTVLLNGYAVSYRTYVKSWKFGKQTMKCSSGTKTAHICTSVNGIEGSHMMTIVGYDDTLEIDLNGDGIADTKGALKVVNSWGKIWGDSGYGWIAYDALYRESATNGADNKNREPAIIDNCVYYLHPRQSYTPLLLAELTISTDSRGQLAVQLGISTDKKSVPEQIRYLYRKSGEMEDEYLPFNYTWNSVGLNYNFTGGTKKESGTFVFDLTSVISDFWDGTEKTIQQGADTQFYIKISDKNKDNYSSTLVKCRLIDRVNDSIKTINCNTTVNGNSTTKRIGYTIVPKLVKSTKEFVSSFNYPIQKETVNDTNIYVTDNFGVQVPLIKTLSLDRKSISLLPKNEIGYQSGNYYTLVHTKKLLTDGGNGLGNESKYYFYVP